MNDPLGLSLKPKNTAQPSSQVDNEQMALRERVKKKRKPLMDKEEEDNGSQL